MADLELGSTFAGCRLEAVAGRGGMGVVYRATQLALGRPVALKAITPQLAQDAGFRERFQRESQIAASIDHPNVIPIYEAGELDGTLYLIMRWVDGTDLRMLLQSSGRLAPARAIGLLIPVASALAAAHRRGLVHRDVKPANVLIAQGGDADEHVYLTDFGIARRADGESGMTRTGVFIGTADYAAPERILGAKGDAASDIYSFGCVLYETLTGSGPFERATELLTMYAQVSDPPPSARAAVPEVPARLDAIVTRAMAKSPADRFGSAAEIVTAFQHALADVDTEETEPPETVQALAPPETVLAPPEPPETVYTPEPPETVYTPEPPETVYTPEPPETVPAPPPGPAPSRRWRGPAAAAVVLAAAAIAVIVVLLTGGSGGSPPPAGTPTVASPQVPVGSASVGAPVTLIEPGSKPAGLALAGGSLWIADAGRGRIVGRLGNGGPTDVPVGGQPEGVAIDGRGRVWVTNTGPQRVTVYDPASHKAQAVTVGAGPGPIAITSDAAWVANTGEQSVTRIDLGTLHPQRISLPSAPTAIVAAYARVWVATANDSMAVLDDNGMPDPVAGPSLPGQGVAGAFSDGVWILGSVGGTGALTRIDPRTPSSVQAGGQRVYAIHPSPAIGSQPSDVGANPADHAIWVISQSDRTLTRFGTAGGTDGQMLTQIRFPAPPVHLTVGDHMLWVDTPSTDQIYMVAF